MIKKLFLLLVLTDASRIRADHRRRPPSVPARRAASPHLARDDLRHSRERQRARGRCGRSRRQVRLRDDGDGARRCDQRRPRRGQRSSPRDALQSRKRAPILTIAAWRRRDRGERAGRRRPRADPPVNYGVRAAEVLEGNIGYLNTAGSWNPTRRARRWSHAMAMLANTDAMIVDVRNCPGGSADRVSYPRQLLLRPGKARADESLQPALNRRCRARPSTCPASGGRDVGLYILTGRKAASACESFAFTLQQWGRAKTVGEKTAGAGNNNMIVDAGGGLGFSDLDGHREASEE